MYAVEFESKIVNGSILLPQEYQNLDNLTNLKVVLMSENPLFESSLNYQNSPQFKKDSAMLQTRLEQYQNGGTTEFSKLDDAFWNDTEARLLKRHS